MKIISWCDKSHTRTWCSFIMQGNENVTTATPDNLVNQFSVIKHEFFTIIDDLN